MYTIVGIFSVGVILFMRTFVATPFVTNGQWMYPTVKDQEYVFVEKNNTDFQRGNIVIIKPGVDKSREYYIKRIIWLPWETISFSWGKVFIKNKWEYEFLELNEPFLSSSNRWNTSMPEYIEEKEFLIPNDSYWVMWDNRNNSADSRQCFQNCFGKEISAHFIKKTQITGKVLGK